MEDVEAVPAIADELELLGEGQSGAMRAFIPKCAATDDDDGALSCLKRVRNRFGELGQQAKVRAQKFRLIGQIRFRADREDLRALFPDSLLDPRIHQRRFAAQVRADKQDHIGIFNIGNARVEIDGR